MKKTERDVGIELARILGCLIVIGVHISLDDYSNGNYDLSRGFINCLLADGVAVFWLITGCFLFCSHNYRKVLIRMAKTIAIPIAILAVFNLFFSGWIEFGGDLISSVYNTPAEYFQGFKEAISLYPTIPQSGHLWYCYTYILVIITFPVLDAFVQWMNQDCQREKAFCAITFILLVINDCTQNQMLNFSHHGLNAAVPAAIEILWGHIIYRHKEKLLLTKGKIVYLLFLFFSFVALNYMRMYIVLYTGSKAICCGQAFL